MKAEDKIEKPQDTESYTPEDLEKMSPLDLKLAILKK